MCGGSPEKAPQTYVPTGQPQADAIAQTGIQSLSNTGQNLQSSVDPALANISQNVINNPYFTPAMQGIQNVSNLSQGVGNQQLAMGQGLQHLGQYAAGYGQATAPIAAGAGAQGYGQLQSLVPATTTPELAAAMQVLQTGFDPQQDLYNRQYQQMRDQQNAINAMSGVAGTPYGAGIAGDASRNFNIDWQNQQLGRQLQALSGYNTAASTAAGNAANLVGTGANVLNNGLTTGANLLTSTGGLANTSAMNAAQLGTQGLNTLAQGAQMPYDLWLQQQQAGLAALGAQIQGTNAAAGLTQAGIGDALNYMSTGQNATSVNQNAVAQNNQAAANQSAGFGNLFGSLAGAFLFA